MGRLILAGTGLERYRNIQLPTEMPPPPPPEEIMPPAELSAEKAAALDFVDGWPGLDLRICGCPVLRFWKGGAFDSVSFSLYSCSIEVSLNPELLAKLTQIAGCPIFAPFAKVGILSFVSAELQ